MKVIFDKDSDRFKLDLQDRSFEWSYFEIDFKQKDENYNLVVIGANGLFVSTNYYEKNIKPCINIVLSRGNEIISFVFIECKSIIFTANTLKIGSDLQITYYESGDRLLEFNGYDKKKVPISLKMLFHPEDFLNSSNLEFSPDKCGLEWGISSLRYLVSGSIQYDTQEIILKKEIGYHDFNYCKNADEFYHSITSWTWWRAQNESTKIMFFEASNRFKPENILILDTSTGTKYLKNITYNSSFSITPLLLKYPKHIDIKTSDESISLLCIDNRDYKVKILGKSLSGLFYTRQNIIVDLDTAGNNQRLTGTLEFFAPQKMNNKLIRFAFVQGLYEDRKNILSKLFLK